MLRSSVHVWSALLRSTAPSRDLCHSVFYAPPQCSMCTQLTSRALLPALGRVCNLEKNALQQSWNPSSTVPSKPGHTQSDRSAPEIQNVARHAPLLQLTTGRRVRVAFAECGVASGERPGPGARAGGLAGWRAGFGLSLRVIHWPLATGLPSRWVARARCAIDPLRWPRVAVSLLAAIV